MQTEVAMTIYAILLLAFSVGVLLREEHKFGWRCKVRPFTHQVYMMYLSKVLTSASWIKDKKEYSFITIGELDKTLVNMQTAILIHNSMVGYLKSYSHYWDVWRDDGYTVNDRYDRIKRIYETSQKLRSLRLQLYWKHRDATKAKSVGV